MIFDKIMKTTRKATTTTKVRIVDITTLYLKVILA